MVKDIPLWRKCLAEAVGTGIIAFFGTAPIAVGITTGAIVGLGQGATVVGFGVALALYTSVGVSGGHLNPCLSVAFALFRPKDFPRRHMIPYILSQLFGALLGSLFVLATYNNPIKRMEAAQGITRGEENSILSAMAFGCYFPNPRAVNVESDDVTALGAMSVEALGSAVLMFMILVVTDERNPQRPTPGMANFFVGFTVFCLISVFDPLTLAGWNPARDFSPRIVALIGGWGFSVAFKGWWVYTIGPIVGAPVGALLYDALIAPGLPAVSDEKSPGTDAAAVEQALAIIRETKAQVLGKPSSEDNNEAEQCR